MWYAVFGLLAGTVVILGELRRRGLDRWRADDAALAEKLADHCRRIIFTLNDSAVRGNEFRVAQWLVQLSKGLRNLGRRYAGGEAMAKKLDEVCRYFILYPVAVSEGADSMVRSAIGETGTWLVAQGFVDAEDLHVEQ